MIPERLHLNFARDPEVFMIPLAFPKLSSFLKERVLLYLQEELFGRRFEPGEFDRMSPQEQQNKSDQMMMLIQRWREERRAEALKKGKR